MDHDIRNVIIPAPATHPFPGLVKELLDFAASAAMGHCGAGDFLLGQAGEED